MMILPACITVTMSFAIYAFTGAFFFIIIHFGEAPLSDITILHLNLPKHKSGKR
jgi:hypothetical protein